MILLSGMLIGGNLIGLGFKNPESIDSWSKVVLYFIIAIICIIINVTKEPWEKG